MKQKLCLLGTILTNCKLIILDEPMSGLDPKARILVKNIIKEAKSDGKTILLSSHILSDINEICDNVSIVNKKEIYFSGTPDEMLKKGKSKDIENSFMNIISS